MRTAKPKKKRPSKDQARAWLSTVIAPLASALAVEEERLGRGNWSFRCETQDFEFLWPIERMISARYWPNLEQFLRYRPDVRRQSQDHDRTLDGLRSVARAAYKSAVQNEQFLALAASTPVPETDRRYLAEYVVNGIRDLASYYTHHEMWIRDGARFLALREKPALSGEFRALETAGRSFADSVGVLRSAVSVLQVELADEYRLPPVDPVHARA